MASSTSLRSTRSPSSFSASRVRVTTRSSGGWATDRMRAPDRCLRRSIQNMGGVSGFSRVSWVSWGLGWLGLAESNSLTFPWAGVRRAKITSSRLG